MVDMVDDHKNNGAGKLTPLFSSGSSEWETPQWLFDKIQDEFMFTMDVCANAENTKCQYYISPAQDAFSRKWHGMCWMNPPYGRGIKRWMERALEQAQKGNGTVVCLVPARTDTRWWWDTARHGEVRLIKGRIKFVGAESGAPFPSAVVIFRRGMNISPSTTYWDVKNE